MDDGMFTRSMGMLLIKNHKGLVIEVGDIRQ